VREPSKEIVRTVQQSSLPTLLLRVPDEEILAASDEAGRLLGVPAGELVGRNVEEFADDPPSGALPLVASGRLSGFQARRRMTSAGGDSQPLQVWIRAAELTAPVGFAVAILWPGGRDAWSYLPASDGAESAPTVVGTVNGHLEVERISDDVRHLGFAAEEAIGSSVFRLFDVTSVADVLHALADATEKERALCVVVNVHVDGEPAMAELMLRPLRPAPSFSFSLLCPGTEVVRQGNDEGRLQQIGRGLHALALAEAFAFLDEADLPGVANLTTRELDITARLLSGDRVPGIARAIYLSPSTVRNHLSNVYRKLRVGSQQELIELFRESADRLAGDDVSSR
jgi:DNA-binding CsgD family transcriptional regulator/PAS domain-containing protein